MNWIRNLWKAKNNRLPEEVEFLKRTIKLELEIDGIVIYVTKLFYNKKKHKIELRYITPDTKYDDYIQTDEFRNKVKDCLKEMSKRSKMSGQSL